MPASAGPSAMPASATAKSTNQSVMISVVTATNGAAFCCPEDGGQYFCVRARCGATPSQTLTRCRKADQIEIYVAKNDKPKPMPAASSTPVTAGESPPTC